MMTQRTRPPIHPGETLSEDVMDALGLDATQVGNILGVPPDWITEIIHGRRAISAGMALRLSRWLGTSAEFWLRLQEDYDLELAGIEHGEEIERTVTPRSVPAIPGVSP